MAQHTVTILPDATPGVVNPILTQMSNQQNFLTDNTSSYASSKTTPLLVRYWCAAWTKTQIQKYIPLSATVDKIVIKAVASLDGSGKGAAELSGYIYNSNNTDYSAYSKSESAFAVNGDTWITGTLETLTNVPSSFLTQGLMVEGNMVHSDILSRTMRLATVKAEVTYTLPDYYLDLNGYLDGATSGNISGYGTADVYINSSRVAAGVTDFYTTYEAGSTYEIKNIVPTAGHSYNGVYSGSLTGTLNSDTSVYLNFTTVSTTVTVSFDSQGGSSVSSRTLNAGQPYGTLPTPTRSGYTFCGWYDKEPSYNGGTFNGTSDFVALGRSKMYTNKTYIMVSAKKDNWATISSPSQQILSCTEGGGWGIGYGANTVGHGTEIYIGGTGYKGIDFEISSLSSGWHTFLVTFDGATFKGYVDGVQKGSVSVSGAISYNSSNGIFVGAEAGTSTSTPAGSYFNGKIGSVIIADAPISQINANSTVLGTNHTLYAYWQPIDEGINNIRFGAAAPMQIYIGNQQVKQVYIGSTLVYSIST